MSKPLIIFIGLLSPLFLWAVVSVAAKRSLSTMKSILRVLRVWHWLFVIVGVVLLIGFYGQPPSRYGWGALMFSFGLIWPEQWLKRQMGTSPESPVPRR